MVGLLWHRDFRLLWTGETTSSLGSSVSSVALPLVALAELQAGVFAVSLLSAAVWLPWLVIGLPAGAWVDRLPRRHVMLVADVTSLAVFASVPIAAISGWLTMAQLLVVALLAGSAALFFDTAYRALLPALVAPEDLLEGNANFKAARRSPASRVLAWPASSPRSPARSVAWSSTQPALLCPPCACDRFRWLPSRWHSAGSFGGRSSKA
jgi:MFS family permease